MKEDGNIPFRVVKAFSYQKSTIDKTLSDIRTESNSIQIPVTEDYNFVFNTTTKELIGYREVNT